MITYNDFTGEIVIEWHEKRDKQAAPIYHSFNRIPNMAQLHPIDPAKVVRAHFEGAMPGWMKDYAKEHDYKCNSTQLNGKHGWWIANWGAYKKGEKPFSAPTLKGAVRQLSQHIPDAYAEGKERILENLDNIVRNLRNYPTAFIPFGIYYRPEEVHGEQGCLLVEDIILPQGSDESPEDYRSRIVKDGRLDTMIFELSTPLPDPEPQEKEGEAVQLMTEDEQVIPLGDIEEVEEVGEMPNEFLLGDLEELPMSDFSFDELPIQEFSFDEEPGSESSNETVLIAETDKQSQKAFSIENKDKVIVDMNNDQSAIQAEEVVILDDDNVTNDPPNIEHQELIEVESVKESIDMEEERKQEAVEEEQTVSEPTPVTTSAAAKTKGHSSKSNKNTAIFGEAKAAGNKPVSADQFSLF